MTILAEIHAGHDPIIYRIPCLELYCAAWPESIRACPGWDDVTVKEAEGYDERLYQNDVAMPRH